MHARHPLIDEQSALVRVMGERFRASRNLNRLALTDAATGLGYENPSKLSKVENASDTNSVPLWLIRRASLFFDVSTDFLFGLSEDWERDAMARDTTACARYLAEQNAAYVGRQIAETRRLVERVSTIQTSTDGLSTAVDELLTAVLKFWTLNQEFEEMKGSATVVAALERAEAASRDARGKLWRLRQEVLKR